MLVKISGQKGASFIDSKTPLTQKHHYLCTTEQRRNGNPLQHSCLETPIDGGAW